MRLWSIHPRYLDVKGLLAVWREGLLARKVLRGETKGYRNHPQLDRFKRAPDPLAAIDDYLAAICDHATQRGYSFDRSKIAPTGRAPLIDVTDGQIAYEWSHLLSKLKARSPDHYALWSGHTHPGPHPLFRVVPGPIEPWEKPIIITPDESWRDTARSLFLTHTAAPVRDFFSIQMGYERSPRGLSVVVEWVEAQPLLAAVRGSLPAGLVAFIGMHIEKYTRTFDGVAGFEVVLAPGEDQFEILRLGCSAERIEGDGLVDVFKGFHARYGVDITRVQTDTVEFNLLTIPQDPERLAAELYDLCPDIVDQGTRTLERLVETLAASLQVTLWWD